MKWSKDAAHPGHRRFTRMLLLLSLYAGCAYAGFDHELPLDQSGIWARKYQNGLEYGTVALEVAGSLWYGNNDEIGHTFWQSVDSSVISGLGALGLKYAFSRARPNQGNNPNLWFQGSGHQSFPSGEVTLQASFEPGARGVPTSRRRRASSRTVTGVWVAAATSASSVSSGRPPVKNRQIPRSSGR